MFLLKNRYAVYASPGLKNSECEDPENDCLEGKYSDRYYPEWDLFIHYPDEEDPDEKVLVEKVPEEKVQNNRILVKRVPEGGFLEHPRTTRDIVKPYAINDPSAACLWCDLGWELGSWAIRGVFWEKTKLLRVQLRDDHRISKLI